MSTTEKAKDLLEQLETQLIELTSSDGWQRYLDMQARFHRYSLNNTLLILQQFPEASRIAGFHTWKNLNRAVVKGAKAIKILAPRTVTVTEQRDDGSDYKRKKIVGFGVANVFDISQTEGEDLPEVITKLDGDVPSGLLDELLVFALEQGCDVEIGDARGANGYFRNDIKQIVVGHHLPMAQQTKTLAHEIGHLLLHSDLDQRDLHLNRADKELEAESVAYIVCQHFGLDTTDYSLGYISCWQGDDESLRQGFRQSAVRIQKAASQVIDAVTKSLMGGSQSADESPTNDQELDDETSPGPHLRQEIADERLQVA